MQKIIDKILGSLGPSLKEKGRFVKFSRQGYKSIELSRDNFKDIKNLDLKNRIAFIDGGNSEILKAANFSLQFIRVYYSVYRENKRVKSRRYEFYLLIKAKEKDNEIFYETETFGDKIINNLSFNSFDESILQGKNRASVSFLGNIARRFAELSVIKMVIDELNKDDVIVLDGDLEAKYTNEEIYLDGIYRKAMEKDIVVSALSKTCGLFTDKGNSVLSVLNEMSEKEEWYYTNVAEINNEKHKAEMFFIKLNKKSKYTFRFEIFNKQKDKINNVLSLLKNNSLDNVFIGYPYGLIEADRFARVSNRETEYIKTNFMVRAGKQWKTISSYLRTTNSHNILDNIG